jgi:hypothetical protein
MIDLNVAIKAWKQLNDQIEKALNEKDMILRQGKQETRVKGYYRDNGDIVVITSPVSVKYKELVEIGVAAMMRTDWEKFVYIGTDNGKHLFKIDL